MKIHNLALVILCLLTMAVSVSAIGDITVSPTMPMNFAHAQPGPNSSITVHQGGPDSPEVIYWNETVDLSLVEGWYGMVQRYPGGEIVDVSTFTHRIFISPLIFPVGRWYQWSPEGINGNGNNIAFDVSDKTRQIKNMAYVNISGNITRSNETKVSENLPIAPRKIADYLVAKGDPLNVTFSGAAQVWVFSEHSQDLSWIQPRIAVNFTIYTIDEINALSPGNYTVMIQHLGKNNVADVSYSKYKRVRSDNSLEEVVYSPFALNSNTTVTGWQPFMIQEEVMKKINAGMWINQSIGPYNIFDDTYDLEKLKIENPRTDITLIDEYTRGNTSEEASLIRIAGYTNVANGTSLKIVFDYDKQNVRTITNHMQVVNATGNSIGDSRQFSVIFPLYYAEISEGEHFFTAISRDGILDTVPYHLIYLPEGQQPDLYRGKYMSNNPYVPTPTPEKIVVKETVLVPGTPQYIDREVIKVVEVAPWYLSFPWILIWVVIIATAGYLYWRFVLP